MENTMHEQLAEAVKKYVDSLSVEDMADIISSDIYHSLKSEPDSEILAFIDSMGVAQ